MSEQQTEKFRLKKVDNGDIEETCKNILGGKPLEDICSFVDSYTEALLESQFDENNYKYEITPQGVFEIVEYENIGYPDVFEASENHDGTIDVLVSYYNGGCSTSEAIKVALEKMNKVD